MRAFCDRHGLILFEDNCESMGATLNGKQCGTFGDIGTFSSFFSHHISTMEGGILVTDNTELYHMPARCARTAGRATSRRTRRSTTSATTTSSRPIVSSCQGTTRGRSS